MKALTLLRERAIKLRKKGLSYNEIRRSVPVAKSTLSLWLKLVPLKEEYKKRLYSKQIAILSLGPQSQRARRIREIKEIISVAGKDIKLPVSYEAYRLMGAALYWAEGSKGKGFEITNSDPFFILFMVRWIEKIFAVPAKSMKARLNIYSQQNDHKIKKFWSELTGIPYNNFGKSYVKPLSKGFKKNNLYYGTMRIEVPRGTNMRYKVFGWLKAVLKNIEPKVIFTEKKWSSLKKVARPVNLA